MDIDKSFDSEDTATRKPENEHGALARIDQFELMQELGGGGFGTVYLAWDGAAGVYYAVKGLPPEVKTNPEELENVRGNFALVSRLIHQNIACAHMLHPAKDVVYYSDDVKQKLRVMPGEFLLVMEYAPGVTLSRWRKQFPDKKVPLPLAVEITRQIAAALDFAHGRKVLHRDVKPSNVMIETCKDGSLAVRVVDFGLAAEIRSSMGRVSRQIRDTSGTRPYMAPEQWAGEKQGPATDQYALAAMFCELATGEVPFASAFDTGDKDLMERAVETRRFSPPPELPAAMRKALSRALSKKPEDRFATCGAFARALEKRASGWKAKIAAVAAIAAIAAGVTVAAANGKWRMANGELKDGAGSDARPPESNEERELDLGNCEKMTMIYVQPGEFMMGSKDGNREEKPVHRVRITKGFWLGKYEVTRAQWRAVMGNDPSGSYDDDHPVGRVSWNDCQEFIKRVNDKARRAFGGEARLPTEAEWEYACRAGTTGKYASDLGSMAWYADNSDSETHPVGQKSANDWGFYDMHGNVWEWCNDWCGSNYYASSPGADPQGPSAAGRYRVLRGGGFDSDAWNCRSANRNGHVSGYRGRVVGFRLACSAEPF